MSWTKVWGYVTVSSALQPPQLGLKKSNSTSFPVDFACVTASSTDVSQRSVPATELRAIMLSCSWCVQLLCSEPPILVRNRPELGSFSDTLPFRQKGPPWRAYLCIVLARVYLWEEEVFTMICIRKAITTALLAIGIVPILAACSSTGGVHSNAAATGNLPRLRIAMITHQAPGDTFWDIIRRGAEAAAAKDNVQLIYSNDQNASGQAVLIQNAIDQRVDGIAVTLPTPDALAGEIRKAQNAGIPIVAFNAGFDAWKRLGIPMYVGQDETLAGHAAGQRLNREGARHVLCVIQSQGEVQLEARCTGVKQGLTSGRTEKIYVNGV